MARLKTYPLPAALTGVFPPFRWSVEKLWAENATSQRLATDQLWWHLDLPVWPTAPPERIFDLSPAQVLRYPDRFPERMARIRAADLGYPLELYDYEGRFVMIDGYHRLARMRLQGVSTAMIRRHAPSVMERIGRDP